MRKFTLFFMSLFLAFGTAMAKDEVKGFNSPEVYPASGELVTAVYNVRMTFSKEVVIAQSEVGINVVNSETNEVVKITSCQGDEWDPYSATFCFEKIEVDGKDGKEYLDQYIETPGTYTYTIPAGIIKSVDGEEFAGGTYSFSIVGTFEVVDWSPKEAAQVEDIIVTFDTEIVDVKAPASGLWIVDNYWSPVVKVSEAVIGDDKKSVILVLETPITTPGTYNFDLYQGVFVSENAISQYLSGWFSVVDPNPSFSTNYKDGEKVKELGNFEITFSNVKTVELLTTEFTVYVPGEGTVNGTAKLENNKIVVTFEQSLAEDGFYLFYIPEGMFTMDGVENEEREVNVELSSQQVAPLEIVSVKFMADADGNIESVRVEYNQQVALAYDEDWQCISSNIDLLDEEGNAINLLESWNPALPYTTFEYVLGEYDNSWNIVKTPITKAGTYVLDLSQIVVEYGYDPTNWSYNAVGFCEEVYTYTHESSAIKNVQASEGGQIIYDVLGRRVERITGAGLYIVNGKKVVIK